MSAAPALVPRSERLFIVRRRVNAESVARERFVPHGVRRSANLQRKRPGQRVITKLGQTREPELAGISFAAAPADDADLMSADRDPRVPMSAANRLRKGRCVEL